MGYWTFKVLAYVGHRTFETDDYRGIISYLSNGYDLNTSMGRHFVINNETIYHGLCDGTCKKNQLSFRDINKSLF